MGERKILVGASGVVILAGFATAAWLAVTGRLLHIEGLSLGLIALLVSVVFLVAITPELLRLYPLPPAVDEAVHHHASGASIPLFMRVWGILLFLTAIEVGLARMQLGVTIMLFALMGLSIMKAAMIVAYFMHLRFERLSMVLTLIPVLVMCICLLGVFFPDGARMREQGRDRQKGNDMLQVTVDKAVDPADNPEK
jgi:cytochrome c oxidase subunit 4